MPLRSSAGVLGGPSSSPSERRSPWPVVLTSLGASTLFVIVLGVVAWATRDASSSGVVAQVAEPAAVVEPAVDPASTPATTAADVLRAATPVVERCFTAAVAFDPALGGRVQVELVVDGEGAGAARVVDPGASPFLISCVARQGRGLKLPPWPLRATVRGPFFLDAQKGTATVVEDGVSVAAP